MTRSRDGSMVVAAVALAGVLCCSVGWTADERLPTVTEVQAGYRQNYGQFVQPHITLARTLRPGAAMRKWWQQQAQRMQQALADPARSPKQRQAAQQALDEARRELESPVQEIVRHEDFWTDRKGWQLRVPFRDANGLPPAEHMFPTAALSATTLPTAFRRHRIYTFSPLASPAMSVWYGVPNPGAPAYARRADAILADLPAEFQLPPLGAVAGPTAFLAHPVDTVFFRPGGTLSVVGYESQGGQRTLKVMHTWLTPSREPHRTPGELLAGDVITAWLDPARGYLPVRAEWRRQLQLAGKQLNPDHRHIHQVLRVTRIERVAGAGFYPVEGVIELRSLDPDAGLLPEIDALAAGKKFNPQLIVENEWVWRVLKIEPQAAADPTIYQANWPRATEIFDEARLTAKQRVEPLAIGQTAPPLKVTAWTDGAEHSLADLRGKVTILNFWISWQDPCMAPLPLLEHLHQKYRAAGVSVLGIHVGNIELDELKRAAEEGGVTFPNALDIGTDQTPLSTLSRYRVQFYPTTLVIDRAGNLAWSSAGASTRDQAAKVAGQLKIPFPFPQQMPVPDQLEQWNRILGTLLENEIRRALQSP